MSIADITDIADISYIPGIAFTENRFPVQCGAVRGASGVRPLARLPGAPDGGLPGLGQNLMITRCVDRADGTAA